jgi:hypothetical protein
LGTHLKEMMSAYIEHACIRRLIVTLFTVVKLCNLPRCLSRDEWIKKIRYIYTSKYYLAINKNENHVIYRNVDGARGH